MIYDDEIERYSKHIMSDQESAQILLRTSQINSLEKVKKIIEDSGNQIIQLDHLDPNLVLMKLDVKDMREIVLKLIESGFNMIKGINAASR